MLRQKKIFLLTGPTAVGKTALSLQLAQDLEAEILSCDSLLFYKGMNIGTAKPSAEERSLVPHHGIDLCPPNEQFDVVRFRDFALRCAQEIYDRGKNILVVGGSGFYLKSFYEPIADRVEISAEVKTEVNQLFEKDGLDVIVARLRLLNHNQLGTLDIHNPRRVIPALERCLQTGKTLAELQNEFSKLPDPWQAWEKITIRLTRPRDVLHERAAERVKYMLDDGLIDEVRSLLTKGLLQNPSAANAIGYREVIHFLEKENGNTQELAEEITINTRRLIRKQETWYNHQLPPYYSLDLETFSPKKYADLLGKIKKDA